jgi:flagellar hook-associated protein 3 FlgL
MRISTNTLYQLGINQINTLQSEQSKLNLQISTGKRILSAADEPVAAARALELVIAKNANTKFSDNRVGAQFKLNTLETSLSSISDLLIAAQTITVGAGNGTYSNQDRASIAAELGGSLQQIIGLANSQDASGNYIYAGFKTTTTPFVANSTGASYAGDNQQQLIQVDTQQQMAVSFSGSSVFQTGTNDVFKTLSDLVTLLNTPATPAIPFNADGLKTALTNLQGSLDNILNIRATVGAQQNVLDAMNNAGSARDMQYTTALSGLQDLDYASALSTMSKNQSIMEAAQKSFVAITSLSLFKFM